MVAGPEIPLPVFRKLRVFAVDPGMTARFETAVVNELTVQIPWEPLEPGPTGAYVAVVDEDPSGRRLHTPVDLSQPELLAQDGLPPSDGNPHFRQQMTYAVAMRTIRNFERALGRPTHWPPELEDGEPTYRPRLNLYPHYWEASKARCIPETGLCFGYFTSAPASPVPGTLVFTCLSQDVIVQQVTNALLNGMGFEFGPSNDDTPVRTAFSDLVALLQHFGESDVLRAQIAAARGRLEQSMQLGAMALQIGQAQGYPDGVRNVFGATAEDGSWQPHRPDATNRQIAADPDKRAQILVRAVFEAFRKIYEARVADLRRIASKGTGVLPEGHLHPDLVNRLTLEASESARHVRHMCIRALDYLPPIDVSFGDFLRALITADYDLYPVDERHYRAAVIDGFRGCGILPPELNTLSVDTLLWRSPPAGTELGVVTRFVDRLSTLATNWTLPIEREARWKLLESWKADLESALKDAGGTLAGVDLDAPFEVTQLDLREHAGPTGTLSQQWVIKLVQSSRTAGCTLLVDADDGTPRYLIAKPPNDDHAPSPLARASSEASLTRLATERSLRVFAFDPSLGTQLETAGINEVTLRIPWERDAHGEDTLEPGPVGEYVEVVDHDPASQRSYAPVDLNEERIVAQDGLAPSESNPQFHQQMVYAVTMRVIRDFEQALGRLALWAPRRVSSNGKSKDTFVRRLRIYPHALREANAYYSPAKEALLFGYFPAPTEAGGADLTVFTCLSHDIVAHEVTHALLDGMHQRFDEPSNPDVLAFHEAFADIVALFEHFSLPEVLRHQIAATRGDLASQNRLGELAQEFGQAIGKRGALRSAIGTTDPQTGRWKPLEPDPDDYQRVTEPHARGALLVAAVFDAFLTIYKSRVADLLRIATDGSGVLPAGELHPDLVSRLADEAAASASNVLQMCIRALDYMPPVDITFGDYLRAIVTADYEQDPIDAAHRRVAFVEAFRRYGIVPQDIRALSVEGLRWRELPEDERVVLERVKRWFTLVDSWNLTCDREAVFDLMSGVRADLHGCVKELLEHTPTALSGIDATQTFEVHSVRPSIGHDWNERPRLKWVIELTQRLPQEGFTFRGGCTLLVDAETGAVSYSIDKPISDEARLERHRRFVDDDGDEGLAATYFGSVTSGLEEPFAMLHRY